ncbi:MAG TPA: AMP-binding protein [Bdellovibrionota bacterium]|nr:AMP-binding protein [Bdellovibrionota bacterium]
MNFVETILGNLEKSTADPAVIEVYGQTSAPTTRAQLKEMVERARVYLATAGVRAGDRVALLAPNSTRWVACDIAILASGAICVPLYSRQDPKELAYIARDCQPKLLIAGDETLAEAIRREWETPSAIVTFEKIFTAENRPAEIHKITPEEPVTIVYTSGTSGDPKGAVITCGNVDYMLHQTISRLRQATGRDTTTDRVFHFLPVCFMGSRIMLWTQLYRGNPVMLSTDLSNLVQEVATADPNYYLNVPAVLERIRNGVNAKLKEKGGVALRLYKKGEAAYHRRLRGEGRRIDNVWFRLATAMVFCKIRLKIGKSLEFLICGSAALTEETQRWFEMIGVRVLQVYGLTETTAIVTMDQPNSVKAGYVGHAVEGCEAKITGEGELICRGPNIFAGYWNKPEATEAVLRDGWLYTGDLAEADETGNWKIIGRAKNVLIPMSGHNIAPEPIEQQLIDACPGMEHAVIIGHGRPYLTAIVTGKMDNASVERAIESVNESLPHYKKIRKFRRFERGFTIDNGLLTANQKLKRQQIEDQLKQEIESLYLESEAGQGGKGAFANA